MNTNSKNSLSSLSIATFACPRLLSLAILAMNGACASYSTEDLEPSSIALRSGPGISSMNLGEAVTCLATTSGEAKCWGMNDHGQLGQGNLSDIGDDEFPATIPVINIGGTVQEVHSNGQQTFALMQDGTVRAWGANEQYDLGLMHTTQIGDDETPANAAATADPLLGAPAVQLAVGDGFTCARLNDGRVRCWGINEFGQLGHGHTARIGDDEAPETAGDVPLGSPALQIAAGAHHVCAVLVDGDVRCWGANDFGQLGYGHTANIGDDENPASVAAVVLDGPCVRVTAGGLHTCALMASGSVHCWGNGLQGQLGHGVAHVVGDDEPPSVFGDVELGGVAVDLTAGWQHTCAILDTGALRCWGAGSFGQLGLGDTADIGDDETPASVNEVDLGVRTAAAVFSGPLSNSTCAQLDDGALRCWGANSGGQLGGGHTVPLGDDPGEVPGDLPNILVLDADDDV